MKKFLSIVLFLVITICACACTNKKSEKSLIGKWIDVERETIFEYTSDGYYYEYLNENYTTDKTRYRVKGDEITYFLDNDDSTSYSVKFEIDENGHLIINGILEYKPMDIKTSKEESEGKN